MPSKEICEDIKAANPQVDLVCMGKQLKKFRDFAKSIDGTNSIIISGGGPPDCDDAHIGEICKKTRSSSAAGASEDADFCNRLAPPFPSAGISYDDWKGYCKLMYSKQIEKIHSCVK